MSPSFSVADTDLLDRVADGVRGAAAVLLDRHADEVHDHVARWARDAELAASATTSAFSDLFDELARGGRPGAVRAWLLRSAREHVVERLRAGGDEGLPGATLPPAVLAAAAAAADGGRRAARTAWSTVAGLSEPEFSTLDLHVRQGLDAPQVAAVLGEDAEVTAARLVRLQGELGDTVATYGRLAAVRAPVVVHTAVTGVAATRLGEPTTSRTSQLRTVAAVAAAALVVALLGTAAAMVREEVPEPAAGPATAAAEAVPSPSPDGEPEPSTTLEPLSTPSAVPLAQPEPTVEPEPTPEPPPSPSPTPAPSPDPSPAPLTVRIDHPPDGSAFPATEEDPEGRALARAPVAATVEGGSGTASIAWTSDRAPEDVLLTEAAGDVLLWLEAPCISTSHTVTITVEDQGTGETATASVVIVATETCEDPLEVAIEQPADGAIATARRDPDTGTHVLTVDVRVVANDAGLEWTWGADRGAVIATPPQPDGDVQEGQVQVALDDCSASTTIRLTVDVRRPSDEATATDSVSLTITCVE